jgi:hypothetical protein
MLSICALQRVGIDVVPHGKLLVTLFMQRETIDNVSQQEETIDNVSQQEETIDNVSQQEETIDKC